LTVARLRVEHQTYEHANISTRQRVYEESMAEEITTSALALGDEELPEIDELADQIARERRIPRATYRLQLNGDFTFDDARALAPYLHDLGISDCYASPILKARPGSTHGYDVCDPSQINPALGGEAGFDAFTAALHERGMGLIVDVVPNHMGIGECNSWWMDVLENGPSSPYASYFDIDWHPVKHELENKVLLPILEDQYGDVLEQGKLKLAYDAGAFAIVYGPISLPVAPRTSIPILEAQLARLQAAAESDDEAVVELQSILTALSYLPPRTEDEPARRAERLREKQVVKRRLAALTESSAAARAALDATIEQFNGRVGDPRSFDMLDALISAQPYRPAFWRVASEEINYRRFFDINELAAIRVELPEVFADTHQLILARLTAGQITGLRIDHPDGLWDPPGYFRRLQERYLAETIQARRAEAGEPPADPEALARAAARWLDERATNGPGAWPLYVIAEKILSEREPLPRDWAVAGTTGYDFLSAVLGLFVDSANERAFDRLYRDFIAEGRRPGQPGFAELVHAAKQETMRSALASEINALSNQIARITEKNRRYRDFTLRGITQALREVIAYLDVYRTYIAGPGPVSDRDRRYILEAVAEARRHNPNIPRPILQFLRDTLLLRNLDQFAPDDQPAVLSTVMKFQQLTGPVMAKSVEDTAFYNYNRLVALNDVGGNPSQFGGSVADFHQQNATRARDWPHAMLTLTTHDTKRSEDVRARIAVLSELPDDWAAALERWRALNVRHRTQVDGRPAPDGNDEYLLYQTLLGAWPFELLEPGGEPAALAEFCERIVAYMQKATKEAKAHTSWISPDEEYDAAVAQFVRALLADGPNPFLDDMRALARRVAFFGHLNALAQLLLKLTAPGVPDIYQGNELWDFSLVDPDNRRPVDYARRRELLGGLRQASAGDGPGRVELARELLASYSDGRIKLYVTAQTLGLRRERPELFAQGAYQPLEAFGQHAAHVCAFARTHAGASVVVAVPRLVAGLTGGAERQPTGDATWRRGWLELPGARIGQRYRNRLTGELITVGSYDGEPGVALRAVFREFPVALLESSED
jgi:(1->4)-alpha-D-glucan 1-alpha-D-glucosylmutase